MGFGAKGLGPGLDTFATVIMKDPVQQVYNSNLGHTLDTLLDACGFVSDFCLS